MKVKNLKNQKRQQKAIEHLINNKQEEMTHHETNKNKQK
jgi:hypothetical protein